MICLCCNVLIYIVLWFARFLATTLFRNVTLFRHWVLIKIRFQQFLVLKINTDAEPIIVFELETTANLLT